MHVSHVPMVCTFHVMSGMYVVDDTEFFLVESDFYSNDSNVIVYLNHCFASNLA